MDVSSAEVLRSPPEPAAVPAACPAVAVLRTQAVSRLGMSSSLYALCPLYIRSLSALTRGNPGRPAGSLRVGSGGNRLRKAHDGVRGSNSALRRLGLLRRADAVELQLVLRARNGKGRLEQLTGTARQDREDERVKTER